MNELLKVLQETDEDVCGYLESVSVCDFRKQVAEIMSDDGKELVRYAIRQLSVVLKRGEDELQGNHKRLLGKKWIRWTVSG